MAVVTFDKYEGLGNDFVLVEAETEGEVSEADARAWCDRRRGVGGDGVLVMLPARAAGASARMRVINADGSIARMCGNGLRCAALHLATKMGRDRGDVLVETDSGPRACVVDRREDEATVVAEMGVVRVDDEVIVALDGESYPLLRVDAGNPHAVAFRAMSPSEFDRLGPRLSAAREFPDGVNVEIARVVDGMIEVRVWERGAGATLACGTGACAIVAAARARGLVSAETVRVRLPGGELLVRHVLPGGETFLSGPARRVFSGRVNRA